MGRFLLICVSVIAIVTMGGACVEENRIEESPLTTWEPSKSDVFPHSSSGEGTLGIEPRCVRLELETDAGLKYILLVWPEPTYWNSPVQVINFIDVWGENLELRDGDKIAAGGMEYPPVESPEYKGEPTFVLPPDPSCNADELFVLNSIRVIQD